MCTGDSAKLYAPLVTLTLLFVASPYSIYAAEVATYKLTGKEGYLGLRYRYDSDASQQGADPESRNTRTNVEEEFHVQTQGYIYHPKFLKVDLGGGILFSQEDLDTVSGSAKHDDTLYDFNTRLSFLESKPYPLILYYDKSHPSVALSVTDVFIQENEKYGMNFSLREPASPVTLNFESYRDTTNGDSFTQVTDDRNTYQSVSAYSGLGRGGYAQLSHTKNRQDSRSGSKSLPIQPFKVTSKTTELDSRLLLGSKNNINFSLIATDTQEEQDRDLDEFRFAPSLTWQHNANFNSFIRYNFLDRTQSDIDSRNRSGAAGFRYQWNKNVYSNAEVHYDDNTTTGLQQDNYGANGSLTYKHPLDFGELQFNIGLNYDEHNREADSVVQIVDAAYTLAGSTPVTLAHEYIDTSTLVVKRADTNEVLTEGVGNDYVVTVVVNRTQIQKVNLALPTDLDVLVSYQYDPGGTATYTSTGESYQASLEFYKHFLVYVNYRDFEQNLKSGSPTLPLDSSDTTLYGFRADYPLPTDIDLIIGGEVQHEKHDENISSYENNSSYEKNSADMYLQVALPLSSYLHLNMRRLQIDNLFSVEDVDLTRYAMTLKTSPANRLTLSLKLSDEKDIGGSLPRRSKNVTLSGQWRLRKLLIKFDAKRVRDTHGTINDEDTIFNATLRREFR